MCTFCRSRSKRDTIPPDISLGNHIRPPYALWIFDRDAPVRSVLHRLKYGNCPWIGYHLGKIVASSPPSPAAGGWDVILPVPLHPKRLLERGYNQSEWIAMGLAAVLNTKVVSTELLRLRNTRTQTDLPREERLSNVHRAFTISGRTDLEGRSVLLVDDTVTTGATLGSAARMLVAAGAAMVQPVAVARAALRRDEEQHDAGSVISSQHATFLHESSFLSYHM